jgi:hypothetical protein
MSALPPLRHSQQGPSESVEAPDANSSSLNDMLTAVVTIMTELNGAESEADRITAIIKKNYIKTHEAKWQLEFI